MTLRGLIQRPRQVAAFLAGRRTQVRVRMRQQPPGEFQVPQVRNGVATFHAEAAGDFPCWARHVRCPLGKPGDVLAIRETWIYHGSHWSSEDRGTLTHLIGYAADGGKHTVSRTVDDKRGIPHQRPSTPAENVEGSDEWIAYRDYLRRYWARHYSPAVMPLDFARLRYRVLDVRAHLVREISEKDAIAEGMPSNPYYLADGSKDEAMSIPARANFAATWEADHGPGSWERDWCFAATVGRIDGEAA